MEFKSPSFKVNNQKTIDDKYGPLNHPTRNIGTPGDYEKYMSNHVFDRSFIDNNNEKSDDTTFMGRSLSSIKNVLLFFVVIFLILIPHVIGNFISSQHIDVNTYMGIILAFVLGSLVIAFPYHYVRKKIEEMSKKNNKSFS